MPLEAPAQDRLLGDIRRPDGSILVEPSWEELKQKFN
jgi:hypothetical protein